ncbi:MAG TPA: DUF1320 domain-containing protein [Candidatus Kapabacteria bacterium]|nr:DUF1320 domain-containing protein [Candidatus Kapabacteria bacterium]
MQWATIDDLISELGESKLAELSGDGNEIDQSVVDEVLSVATEEVKAYVSVRYELKDAPIPTLLRNLTKKIAIHNLYLRNRREMIVPIEVANEKSDVVRLLVEIARGNVKVELPEKALQIIFHSGDRLFDNVHLEEFRNFRE